MKRIYLIDCPGVVYPAPEDTETEIVLKGVVRVENLQSAEDHIPMVLERVRKEYIVKTYGIKDWKDPLDFLAQYCKKSGRLLKVSHRVLVWCLKPLLFFCSRRLGNILYDRVEKQTWQPELK